MDQKRPLACKACDGLGVRVVPQGGRLAICGRCHGTGDAEPQRDPDPSPPTWKDRRLAIQVPTLSKPAA